MQLIHLIEFLWLLHVQRIIAGSIHSHTDIPQMNSPLDCSQYATDTQIIKLFPFHVHRNPTFRYSTTTYAVMNESDNIHYMNIANQKCIPSIIYCLKHLQQLYVRNTSFCDSKERLPAKFEYLASSLSHLGIYDTRITRLPRQIGKFKHLEFLELFNNSLRSLPSAIGNLSSLTFLSLSNNKLKSLPTTIANLRFLRQITLKNNVHLRSIQAINGLPSLITLDTRHCPIEHLPLYLPQLTNIHMSNNSLQDLDGIESLGNGTSKQKAYHFDKNQIRSIPPQIRFVNNLYWLNLNHNQLDNLPTDIFDILTLSHLYIRDNRFRPQEKKIIAAKFNDTNPKLKLYL